MKTQEKSYLFLSLYPSCSIFHSQSVIVKFSHKNFYGREDGIFFKMDSFKIQNLNPLPLPSSGANINQ